VFGFLRKKNFRKRNGVEVSKETPRRKTLYDVLTFESEKFSFVKAVDVAVTVCGIEFVELKSNINFSSKFNDISGIDGLHEGAVAIFTNLFGIAGIEGILPDCYVEEFIAYNRESKAAVKDFFDIFNNKMLSLQYAYSKKHSVSSLSLPLKKAVIGKLMFSLSGFGFENQDNSVIPEQFKISCHNLFWQCSRSSTGLEAMLSNFFEVDIKVEQFTGGFIEIPKSEQSALGTRYNTIGKDCYLGNKFWDITGGINVIVGPMDFKSYIKFLPKQNARDRKTSPLNKMKEIIKMYVPYGIETKIVFQLDRCHTVGTYLNGEKRLNKDSFIFGIHSDKDANFCERVCSDGV
jgi:type VI secretion system protein ImpH